MGGAYWLHFFMKTQFAKKFEEIASVENLLGAWREFLPGKRGKQDVQEFQLRLTDNILSLHRDLINGAYRHGGYEAFKISDPKPRDIHKATVRDRLIHHAAYRQLYPFFDKTFISDSFSCRNRKGTHRATNRFQKFHYIVSRNDTHQCWVLKCDIKKFFANIDRAMLMEVIAERIQDKKLFWLLSEIIGSFSSARPGVGLPLGNLTSQLFVNVYMNEFDQFAKHTLKAKHYIRYADDFIVLSGNSEWLEIILPEVQNFLSNRLKLSLHPDKTFIKTILSGIDVLGWVHFPDHRVLRTSTKRRAISRVAVEPKQERVAPHTSGC